MMSGPRLSALTHLAAILGLTATAFAADEPPQTLAPFAGRTVAAVELVGHDVTR